MFGSPGHGMSLPPRLSQVIAGEQTNDAGGRNPRCGLAVVRGPDANGDEDDDNDRDPDVHVHLPLGLATAEPQARDIASPSRSVFRISSFGIEIISRPC